MDWTNDKVKHVIAKKKIIDVADMHAIFVNLLARIEELEKQVEGRSVDGPLQVYDITPAKESGSQTFSNRVPR